MEILELKTIRWWEWINDGWVKLALKNRQSFSHSKWERHDEGWSSEWHRWERVGETVTAEYVTDGTDCDGRLTRFNTSEVTGREIWEERGRALMSRHGSKIEYPNPDGYRTPWRRTEAHQRDYSAEAMGY